MPFSAFEPAESNVMPEAIGRLTESYLGGPERLAALTVRFYPSEARAVVWARLNDRSFDSQLTAVSAFADVRQCYEDELELELRFGEPIEGADVPAATQVYARSA
jgi:hypothetical protein